LFEKTALGDLTTVALNLALCASTSTSTFKSIVNLPPWRRRKETQMLDFLIACYQSTVVILDIVQNFIGE
jgi:hypothetical protein